MSDCRPDLPRRDSACADSEPFRPPRQRLRLVAPAQAARAAPSGIVENAMNLPLEPHLRIGIQTIHRRTEPATAAWQPRIDELVSLVQRVDRCGYDSLWTGDHVSFAVPILDPLLQLAQAAVASRRLTLGTSVYLLPLRHPAPVAKQVATLDHLTEGRLIFGVGVGGEFPKEYEVCGVPHNERGARLAEGVAVLRKLWSGDKVSHHGRFYGPFTDVAMQPPPRQPGGPRLWFAGRSAPALRRIGRIGDGYLSYVVTPDMFRSNLQAIADAAAAAERDIAQFGTGHLLFTRLDDSYETALDRATETLSVRYAMDFRRPAMRYCALGTPRQVAERIREFHAAGLRHVILDLLGPYEQRDAQIERFATEAMPLLRDLMAP
jgi:probable F420-dependent oxidoreductase